MPRTALCRCTLHLLILNTVRLERAHGWAIAKAVRLTSDDVLQINQGALYPALQRLEKQGLVRAEWGVSLAGRRAKFYRITNRGRRHLMKERDSWRTFAGAVEAVMSTG